MFRGVFIYFASAIQLSNVFFHINLYIADSFAFLLLEIACNVISVTRIASCGLFLSLFAILSKKPT